MALLFNTLLYCSNRQFYCLNTLPQGLETMDVSLTNSIIYYSILYYNMLYHTTLFYNMLSYTILYEIPHYTWCDIPYHTMLT